MFVAGAYQPETCISCAIVPIASPNALASSLLKVAATDTAEGRPIEPTPVKLLFSEAGPSTSDTRSLPTEEIAGEPYPPLEMRVFMSLMDSWSHFGSS